MKALENPVVGRWRIVEADLWDRDHLDLSGPATLTVRANGDGEIAFGAMQANLNVDYGPDEIGFTWAGFDEMTEVSGAGSAELQEDGSLVIEYHLGDEAVLKAVRQAPRSSDGSPRSVPHTARPARRSTAATAISGP